MFAPRKHNNAKFPAWNSTLSHRSEQITEIGAPFPTQLGEGPNPRRTTEDRLKTCHYDFDEQIESEVLIRCAIASPHEKFRVSRTYLTRMSRFNVLHYLWIIVYPQHLETPLLFVDTILSPPYNHKLRSELPCVQFTPLTLYYVFYHSLRRNAFHQANSIDYVCFITSNCTAC